MPEKLLRFHEDLQKNYNADGDDVIRIEMSSGKAFSAFVVRFGDGFVKVVDDHNVELTLNTAHIAFWNNVNAKSHPHPAREAKRREQEAAEKLEQELAETHKTDTERS